MKKFLSLLMVLTIVCFVTVSICSAVIPRSTSVPTATWDIETQGTYTFSGHTDNETIYTNYRFTGCESYTITITNADDHDRIVRVRRASDGKELKEFSVPAGEEDYVYTFDTSNVWYLEFYSRAETGAIGGYLSYSIIDTGHDFSYTPPDGTYAVTANVSDMVDCNDKVSIYSKMLNSIDNYNSLRLVFDTTMIGDMELTIECQTNIDEGMSYQAVYSGTELLKETSADGDKVSSLNHKTKVYDADSKNVISRTDAYEIALSERITTGDDGLPRYYYRQNATNCSYASYAMFPQEIAFSYLKDFELWEISGTEEYLGRTCVIIEGIPCDYIGEKHNIDGFIMYVDSDTGVLMKLIGVKDNIETPCITVTECSYDEFNVYQGMLNEVNLAEYTN